MPRFFKKLMSYSAYRRTLITYAVSVVVLTALILFSTFFVFSYYFQKSSLKSSELILDQLLENSHAIQNDVEHIFTLVYSESDTLDFISSNTENKLTNYHLYQTLADLKATYTYIRDISVINLDNQVCVQSHGVNVAGSRNYDFLLMMMNSGKPAAPRQISLFLKRQNYDVVSFWKYIPTTNSAVIVDVNADRFNYVISPSEAARSVFVVDGEGQGISTNTSEIFKDEKTYSEYFTEIIREHSDGKENFVYSDARHHLMLFFSKSPSMDWWYIDAQNASSFSQAYQYIVTIFIVIAVLFLSLCIIVSIVFNKRAQAPLVALVNKYRSPKDLQDKPGADELEKIDSALQKIEHERYLNNKYIVSQFLKNILLGEEMPFSVSKEKLREMGESFLAEFYTVLLLKLESRVEIPEKRFAEEYNILRFMVCNIADEIFGTHYRCKTVDLGGQSVAVLLMTEEALREEHILCYNRLQEFSRGNLDLDLYGSLGNTVASQKEIYLSYKTAVQYMEMGHLVKRNSLIDSASAVNVNYREKNEKLVASVESYTELHYANPDLSLKSIAQTFNLSPTYLGKIFKSIKKCSYSVFLTNYRLERSKTLLLETGKPISEIALEVGFANSSYYATVFKGTYGMSPSVYRNNLK